MGVLKRPPKTKSSLKMRNLKSGTPQFQSFRLIQQREQNPKGTFSICKATTMSSTKYCFSENHDRRVSFALFLKILLTHLEKSKQYLVLQQVRLVVMTCTKGHKMGDPSFHPLLDSIELRLRKLVDDDSWRKVQDYTQIYLARQRRKNNRCFMIRNNSITTRTNRQIAHIWYLSKQIYL